MDLVDEQHVVRLQVGQQRGQVAGLLDHRPGSDAQADAQFVGDDVAERGLAQPGRAEDQHVVERFTAAFGGLDVDRKLLAHRLLAEVRSEEHTSELQSLMRTSYAVLRLKKKKDTSHSYTLHIHSNAPNT